VADNTQLNLGSGGDLISTDDLGAGLKVQRIKIQFGADGTATDVQDTIGARVPTKLAESPLLPSALGPAGGLQVEDVTAPANITLQASQVAGNANATTTRTITTGLGKYTTALILVNVTAGGAATGVLQIYLQDSVDGGTTWNDLISSPTFAFGAAGTTMVFTLNANIASTIAAGTAQAIETMPASQSRTGPWGDRIRIREKVSGVSGSPTGPTYTISAVFKR